MTIGYFKSWFRAKKRPIGPMTTDVARQAHEDRTQYTVVAQEGGRPTAFAEVVGDYIGIGFLDKHLREDVSYQFQEKEPGRLFLTMATHREFDGDTDRVASGATYVFGTDGAVKIERTDFDSQTRETSETGADVSGNWEGYPAFGYYASIMRRER